jgi:hypothetical protein
MDVHDNVIRHIVDDAMEPEGQVINFRAWQNRVENASVFMSLGPVAFGPIYVIRNEAWQLGNVGVAQLPGSTPRNPGPVVFKYSGKSSPQARIFVLHNTFWTDRDPTNGSSPVSGGEQIAGSGPSPEAFYLRNNIFRMTRYAFDAPAVAGAWDEDYNYFSTTDESRGLRLKTSFTGDLARYRDVSGQGMHTNVGGTLLDQPLLSSPSTGDLSLAVGAPLVDRGVRIPNVSDREDIDFTGAAPDLGAHER